MGIRDRLGSGVGGELADAIAVVLDERFDALEDVWLAIRNGVDIEDPECPTWALRIAGHLLGVERDPAWTNEEWRYCLRLRARSRVSHGSNPECVLFAQAASPLSDGTADSGPVAVRFYVAGGLDLSDAQKACLSAEALNTIPDVAGLSIVATTIEGAASVFTFDLGPGFDLGTLAGSIYP